MIYLKHAAYGDQHHQAVVTHIPNVHRHSLHSEICINMTSSTWQQKPSQISWALWNIYKISNKDNERMVVDPMFMSIKNLRLFLTAVTLTAVTPTAVILWYNFRWFCTISSALGCILVYSGAFGCIWVHSGAFGCIWVLLGAFMWIQVHSGAFRRILVHLAAFGCIWCIWNIYSMWNKDHRRMTVDSMFMIIKNLSLFLTAVKAVNWIFKSGLISIFKPC